MRIIAFALLLAALMTCGGNEKDTEDKPGAYLDLKFKVVK